MTDNNNANATLIIKEDLISITSDYKIIGIVFKFEKDNDWSNNYLKSIKNNWISTISDNYDNNNNENVTLGIFIDNTSGVVDEYNNNYISGNDNLILQLNDERIANISEENLTIIKIDDNNVISNLDNLNIEFKKKGNIFIDYQEVEEKGEISIYTSEGFPIRGIQFECSPANGSDWDSSVIQTIDNDEFIGFTTNPNENYISDTGNISCMIIPDYTNENSLSYYIGPSEGVNANGDPNPSIKLQLPGKINTTIGLTSMKLIKYIPGDINFNTFISNDELEIFYPHSTNIEERNLRIKEQREEKYEILAKTSNDSEVRAKNQFGLDISRLLNNSNSNAVKENKQIGNRNVEKVRFSGENIKGMAKADFKKVMIENMSSYNKEELIFDASDLTDTLETFLNSKTRSGIQRTEIMAILPDPNNIPLVDLSIGENLGYYALLQNENDAVDFKLVGGHVHDNVIYDNVRIKINKVDQNTGIDEYEITLRESNNLENVLYLSEGYDSTNSNILNGYFYKNSDEGSTNYTFQSTNNSIYFETGDEITLLKGTDNEIIFTLGGAGTGGQEDPVSIDLGSSASSGGDPYITPIYGPNYKLASKCGYYRYLSDIYGDFVINAQVYRLPKNTEQGLDYMYNLLFTENKDLRNKLIDDGFYFNKFLIRNKLTKTNIIIDLDKWNIQDLNNNETISFREENKFYIDNVYFEISNKMYETKMFPYNNLKVIKNMKMSIETKHYGLVELNFEIFLNTQIRSGLAIKTEKTIRLDNSSGLIVCYQRNKDIKIPRLKYIKIKQPAVLKKEINIITEIFKDGKGKNINIDMIQS